MNRPNATADEKTREVCVNVEHYRKHYRVCTIEETIRMELSLSHSLALSVNFRITIYSVTNQRTECCGYLNGSRAVCSDRTH